MARWDFYRHRVSEHETWRWRKTDWDLTVSYSNTTFTSFENCLIDALQHGYDSASIVIVSADPCDARPAPAVLH